MTYSNSWYKKEYLLGLGGLGGGAGGILVAGGPITSSSDGYQIKKSLKFNHGDSPNLRYVPAAASSQKTWTFSAWIKRSLLGNDTGNVQTIFCAGDGSNASKIEWSNDTILYSTNTSGSIVGSTATSGKFRDTSAWYHVVVAHDTLQSEASERLKIYVNGKLQALTTSNTIEQHQNSHVNSALTSVLGGSPLHDGGRYCAMLIADPYVIDGLALSPAAFGEFSTTKLWNPISLALPSPNDGTTWSSSLTSSTGSFYTGQGAAKGFDGDITTQTGSSTGAGTLTFEPTDGIAVRSLVEITSNWNANGLKITTWIDEVEQTYTYHTGSGHAWQTIYEGGGNLTKILLEPPASGKSAEFYAIRVDGVILVDDQNDPTTRNNRNDGTKWSDSSVLARNGSWSAANAAITFDGDLSTTPAWNANYDSAYFKPGWTDIKKIRIYFTEVGTGSAVFSINGTDYKASAAAVGNNAWWTAPSSITTIDSSTGIYWSRVNNADEFKVGAIEIDGHILIDDAVDNSFHLKLDDTSRNSALGKDTLNGKIADATGGLPIYNTTDDYGDVKGSGYRTDSNSSNLLLALAGDTLTDIHATIKGSGSNRTATATGDPTVVTDQSRFYGNSIHFDGNDALRFPDSTDFDFGTGAATVEVWCRPNSTGGDQYILNWGNPTNEPSNSWTGINIYSGEWRIGCFNNLKYQDNYGLKANQWTHIAMTRNGSNLWIHINGVLVSTQNIASAEWNCNTVISVGSEHNGTSHPFTGHIQDLRIYGAAKYTAANFKPPVRNDFTVNNLNGTYGTTGNYLSNASVSPTIASGGWEGGRDQLKYLFNGTTADYLLRASSDSDYTITFSPGISVTSSIEIYAGTAGQEAQTNLNGSPVTYSPGQWFTLFSGSGTFTSLEMQADGNRPGLHGIRVDGVELIDTDTVAPNVDSFVDTPTSYLPTGGDNTAGGESRGNYPTWNPIDVDDVARLSEGNLSYINNGNTWNGVRATFAIPAGKWYWEFTQVGVDGCSYGIASKDTPLNDHVGGTGSTPAHTWGGANWYQNGSGTGTGLAAMADGDIIGVAYDTANGKLHFSRNGQWYGASWATKTIAQVAAGTDPVTSSVQTDTEFFPAHSNYSSGRGCHVNFGQRAFKYTAPTDFKCITSENLPDTFGANNNALEDKNDPSKYFDVQLWAGTATAESIKTRSGFSPDMVWFKERTSTSSNAIVDTVRGATNAAKVIYPDRNEAEATANSTQSITSMDSDGFSLGASDGSINAVGDTYLGWIWDAGGSTSTNTDGDVDAELRVNTTCGTAIATATYDTTNAATTIGTGLSTPVEFALVKNRDYADDWRCYHKDLTTPNDRYLRLNTNVAEQTASSQFSTSNTTFGINGSGLVASGTDSLIVYMFTSVSGFSRFGKYTGGTAPFIYTGFSPRWVLIKSFSDAGAWGIWDSTRDWYNPAYRRVQAHSNSAESGDDANVYVDILSNGFILRNTDTDSNGNTRKYIYAAFAEHPQKTARAR